MTVRLFPVLAASGAMLLLAGCKSTGELVVEDAVGITAVRTACPAVGIPDYTGNITTFARPDSLDSRNIDVSATITGLRNSCDPKASPVKSTVSFKVLARRSDPRGERDVALPWFITVTRGGDSVVAKRIGLVTVHFANGESRAQATVTGSAVVDKAEATLSSDVRDRITHKRKAGSDDAAVDPLADPEVRDAVQKATFEVLVGFQLDEAQLRYNVTR